MIPLRTNTNSPIVEELERAEEAHLKDCPEADFGIRLAALLVDCILPYVAISGIQSLSRALQVFLSHVSEATWSYYLSPSVISFVNINAGKISSFLEITSKILFVFFYFITATSLSGGTPGKLLLGLRVMDSQTGKKLSPGRAFVRCFISLAVNIPSAGLVYVTGVLSKDKKTLHDRLMGTAVKKVHGVR